QGLETANPRLAALRIKASSASSPRCLLWRFLYDGSDSRVSSEIDKVAPREMESVKYLGFDVHQSTISVAVVNADGKLVMQSVIATHAATSLDFIHGLRGTLHLPFAEGTHSAWLYDLLARRVARVVVCNPRQNALLKAGNKSDTGDARKLAELLRAGLL